MKRRNVYDYTAGQEIYVGWFDENAATKIASCADGNPYITGIILWATKQGKLIINTWVNTSNAESYRFAEDESEIAEILVKGGYNSDNKKLQEVLDKYEL